MTRNLLLVRSGARLCALPADHVVEMMRPMPVETLPDVPRFVRGVAVIRAHPTPVVDLRALLGDDSETAPARLVTVRTEQERCVGLLVDAVLGLRAASAIAAEKLPPLLSDAPATLVEALARLDHELLTVLAAGHLLPDEIWQRVADREISP